MGNLDGEPTATATGSAAFTSDTDRHRLHPVDEARVRAWLGFIEETDPEVIADVLTLCAADPSARGYYLSRADEVEAVQVQAPAPAIQGEPVTCSCCRHWKPSRINPTGGMGLCAIQGGGRGYPWSTCSKALAETMFKRGINE